MLGAASHRVAKRVDYEFCGALKVRWPADIAYHPCLPCETWQGRPVSGAVKEIVHLQRGVSSHPFMEFEREG
jgi:hypothetical protein